MQCVVLLLESIEVRLILHPSEQICSLCGSELFVITTTPADGKVHCTGEILCILVSEGRKVFMCVPCLASCVEEMIASPPAVVGGHNPLL